MGSSKSSILARSENSRKRKPYHRHLIRELRLNEFDVLKAAREQPPPGHSSMSTLDLRSGTHHTLYRDSHTTQELVDRFLQEVADPKREWNPRQAAALNRWEQWHRNVDSFCIENSSNVPSEARMTEVIQIISDLFFFGKLSRCRFEWHESLYDAHTGQQSLGLCCPRARYSRDLFVIKMESTDTHLLEGSKSHFTAFMGTLLHECLHGFLEVYSCEKVCRSRACIRSNRRAIGVTGHGEAWQIIASHVEALTRRYLLKSVRIGIPIALSFECEESGLIAVDEVQCHPYSRRIYLQFRRLAKQFETHIEDGSKKISMRPQWTSLPASSSKCPVLAHTLHSRTANESDADFLERLRKLARKKFCRDFSRYAMKDNFTDEKRTDPLPRFSRLAKKE